MFDLDQFIADLRATLPEKSRQPMKEVVARAVSDPAALMRAIGEPDKAGVQVLHRSPDLTVLNLLWAPRQIALPHDHRMPALIGMYTGREDNIFWRRVANPAKFQIEAAGGEALGTGDVTILGHDIVHSVVNPLGKISAAIHVYLGNFLEIERSMWDAETLVEEPYDMKKVVQGMSLQKRDSRRRQPEDQARCHPERARDLYCGLKAPRFARGDSRPVVEIVAEGARPDGRQALRRQEQLGRRQRDDADALAVAQRLGADRLARIRCPWCR